MSALRLSPFTPSSFLSPSASPSVRRNVNLLAVDRRSCCQLTTVISSARAVRPTFVEPYVKPTARFDDRRQASMFGRQEDSGAIPPTTVFLSLLALQSLFPSLSPSVVMLSFFFDVTDDVRRCVPRQAVVAFSVSELTRR